MERTKTKVDKGEPSGAVTLEVAEEISQYRHLSDVAWLYSWFRPLILRLDLV
jgi:hypothetical protein